MSRSVHATALASEDRSSAAPMPTPGIRVERIDRLDAFAALRPEWDRLYAVDPESQFFLSWIFLAGAFESHPGKWFVLVARDGTGRLVGAIALSCSIRWSDSRRQLRNELQFGGRLFWADYGGLLCHPDGEEPTIKALASAVLQENWSRFHLKGFRASDRRFGLFMGHFVDERLTIEALSHRINRGTTDNLLCPSIELPDSFEAYLSGRLGASTRQKIRKYLRMVDAGVEIQLTVTDPVTSDRDLAALESLWTRMWLEQNGPDTPERAAKFARIVRRGLVDGTVRMTLLWRAGAPVGIVAGFVDRVRSSVHFFISARDQSCRDIQVGLVLHTANIRWAIEQNLRVYDFLRGNEPYKYQLGGVESRLRYPLIKTRTGTNLGGRIIATGVADAMRLVERLAREGQTTPAMTGCRQVLEVAPGHAEATRLLQVLTGST